MKYVYFCIFCLIYTLSLYLLLTPIVWFGPVSRFCDEVINGWPHICHSSSPDQTNIAMQLCNTSLMTHPFLPNVQQQTSIILNQPTQLNCCGQYNSCVYSMAGEIQPLIQNFHRNQWWGAVPDHLARWEDRYLILPILTTFTNVKSTWSQGKGKISSKLGSTNSLQEQRRLMFFLGLYFQLFLHFSIFPTGHSISHKKQTQKLRRNEVKQYLVVSSLIEQQFSIHLVFKLRNCLTRVISERCDKRQFSLQLKFELYTILCRNSLIDRENLIISCSFSC